jgi:catechol 2,3-dioxygenase-like lactoylglutathione lyase family enzyme
MSDKASNCARPVNIAYVSVGVADMRAVRELWIEQLGMEVRAHREGPDPEMARVWNIPADQFVEQLLLGTPGAETGLLHFVQFREPADPVRNNAATTDLGPKNLDINCTGMPERVERLSRAGYSFRSAIGEYEIDGIKAREVQMPVHDDVNVVLIEVLSSGFDVDYSKAGFAALTSFVVIVPDAEVEAAFYRQMFAMESIVRHQLSGPAIEMAAALPAGTVLDLHLLGCPDNLFGRMELIEYRGVTGDNRFRRAKAPAAGILGCGFSVDSLDRFLADAAAQNITIMRSLQADTIVSSGLMVELQSPAGLQIRVVQRHVV